MPGGRCCSRRVAARCCSAKPHPPTSSGLGWRPFPQMGCCSNCPLHKLTCCYIKPKPVQALLQAPGTRCQHPGRPAGSAVRPGPRLRRGRCGHAHGCAHRSLQRAHCPHQLQWRPQQPWHPCRPRPLPLQHRQDRPLRLPFRPCPCCHVACACRCCWPLLPRHWLQGPLHWLHLLLPAQVLPPLLNRPRCCPCSGRVVGPAQHRCPSCHPGRGAGQWLEQRPTLPLPARQRRLLRLLPQGDAWAPPAPTASSSLPRCLRGLPPRLPGRVAPTGRAAPLQAVPSPKLLQGPRPPRLLHQPCFCAHRVGAWACYRQQEPRPPRGPGRSRCLPWLAPAAGARGP